MATARGPSCLPSVPLFGCFPISMNGRGLHNPKNWCGLICIVQTLLKWDYFEHEAIMATREEEAKKGAPGPAQAQSKLAEAGNVIHRNVRVVVDHVSRREGGKLSPRALSQGVCRVWQVTFHGALAVFGPAEVPPESEQQCIRST